jgi:hypothetical protein
MIIYLENVIIVVVATGGFDFGCPICEWCAVTDETAQIGKIKAIDGLFLAGNTARSSSMLTLT